MCRAIAIASVHSAPVGRRGQVVEPQRRLGERVRGGQLHRAARVGVHRPDVHLVAVAAGRGGPVVADRDGQEVEHQVRVARPCRWTGRTRRASKWLVAAGPDVAQRTTRSATPGPVAPLERGRDRHRQLGPVLDVHLQVVLHVLADPRQVGHDGDAERATVRTRCRPRKAAATAASRTPRRTRSPRRRRPGGGKPGDPGVAPSGANSTPVARVPSKRIRVACTRVSTRRFGRSMTGCR